MKKAKFIIIAAVAILAVAAIIFGIIFLRSPEYALLRIFKDMERSGCGAVTDHMTEEALDIVEGFNEFPKTDLFKRLFGEGEDIGDIEEYLQDVTFTPMGLEKQRGKATLKLRFAYRDIVSGTLDMELIRRDSTWLINGFTFPEFEKINLLK